MTLVRMDEEVLSSGTYLSVQQTVLAQVHRHRATAPPRHRAT
ncbi:hypothetical protein RR42_s2304 [Cupriavidus basilensis]|uniref:Uncharacterized protein n=1 Tax=Cupriavidus basilensis TaxID=68895 RepID=A0A0C4YT87_9BURK|nr:hypothetical protein RR42_s2304 [Cupriavidus basilensis]